MSREGERERKKGERERELGRKRKNSGPFIMCEKTPDKVRWKI